MIAQARILNAFDRVSPAVVASARGLSTATLHEAAGRIGALPATIKPVDPGFAVFGPAVTVHGPAGDNLWLHRAIYAAQPGDVLVVHCSGGYEYGYWGEVMSTAARARDLGGLVIDGCVRDANMLADVGFPVFARGINIRGTGKDHGAIGWINAAVLISDVIVKPGDLIVGDVDGVVVIPRAEAPDAIAAAKARDAAEIAICTRLSQGETTLGIYEL